MAIKSTFEREADERMGQQVMSARRSILIIGEGSLPFHPASIEQDLPDQKAGPGMPAGRRRKNRRMSLSLVA
jgi:hypothetical protein